MSAPLNSALYLGDVKHKRFTPTLHQFHYPLYMMWLDLDETAQLNHVHPLLGTSGIKLLKFNEKDYLTNYTGNLKERAIAAGQALGIDSVPNNVFLLCQMRCFGIYFSPVNFYFFTNEQGQYTHMLAEVSNTPWNERHCYLVKLNEKVNFKKTFHVSPFMDLDMHYHWQVTISNRSVLIHIANKRGETLLFEAKLRLKRQALMRSNVSSLLKRFPAMTVSIFRSIYWQALKLFFKKVPFLGHSGR
ncbi:DUF1365 domain-containing protein [Pseudoalteromonas sp. JBTF-M23]|uniref:DUF1365 domain-containing protein n=1 Tax=Pseudoalteromonas caenipelagi TaxID=2726988 RepID=A0A849VF07_9GAMM|nr:DUF1365 domain-containing protein [Pseudoalteromonas caenipelagi]NOU50317.1 DUF1365 domain-containing protein [Pseudoalteromonas caenipelagi]